MQGTGGALPDPLRLLRRTLPFPVAEGGGGGRDGATQGQQLPLGPQQRVNEVGGYGSGRLEAAVHDPIQHGTVDLVTDAGQHGQGSIGYRAAKLFVVESSQVGLAPSAPHDDDHVVFPTSPCDLSQAGGHFLRGLGPLHGGGVEVVVEDVAVGVFGQVAQEIAESGRGVGADDGQP